MLARNALAVLATMSLAACGGGASAPIRATGSSTVYPFTKAVADAFAKAGGGHAVPVVDSTGTGAGMMAFCGASDRASADILDASRRMTRAEYDKCNAGKIVEVPIGLDGVAFAESNQGPKLRLTRKAIYLALAANPLGKPNVARTWHDVDPALPAIPIQVLGPPATSGTRASFVDLLLQPGCLEAMPAAKALQTGSDPARFENACRAIRQDGAYVTEGEDDSVIVRGLEKNSEALGLFGYSYLEENASRLNGVPVDGVEPDARSISTGEYPGMRTLYLYVKAKHLKAKPALRDFLALYATMWGPGGPLARHGLIAMSASSRERSKEIIEAAQPLDTAALM